MANTIGLVTYSIRPCLYKALYILLRNLQSLRLNGYSFYTILCWFHPSTGGTVIYLSLGICITPESVQSDKNLFTRVLKVSVYGVKKMRIPLGNSILFLTLGFNKVTPGIIFRRFDKCKGNFLGNKVLARIDVLTRINISARINVSAKVNVSIGTDLSAGFVLSGINFNILKMILFSEVVSIYFITGDKVNSFSIIGIAK